MDDDLPPRGSETYLGDGLYASFDGWQVLLRAPREGGDHWVGLQPDVYRSLIRWVRSYALLKKHMGEPATSNYAAGRVAGLREAAHWLEDAADRLYGEQHTEQWLKGAGQYFRQLADEAEASANATNAVPPTDKLMEARG